MYHFISEDSRCIFNLDSDIMDVQSVSIEYANGTLVNFMMNFNCLGPRADRNFHAIGTKGRRIWGNLHDKKVFYHNNLNSETVSFDTSGDGSSHEGGDRTHSLELLKMMKDKTYKPQQNVNTGYLSAIMCLAADISVRESRQVKFNYNKKGYIEIV